MASPFGFRPWFVLVGVAALSVSSLIDAMGGEERPAAPSALRVVGGKLVHGKRPFQGIGVNYYDAFNRALVDGNDTSCAEGFDGLASKGIPFARLDVSGYWPLYLRLYRDNPEEYFARLDKVVEMAGKAGVGLIPSFFWTTFAVPDLVGESVNQWGVAGSATRQFMRDWVAAVVNRYKFSPAILAWEFGNEWNLAVDLPNASDHRPPIQPGLGTPATRSADDELTTPMVRPAWVEFARLVRRLDPDRPISTGHGEMRASQWHQYKWISGKIPAAQAWVADSAEQTKEMALWMHPDPFDLISIHAYAVPSELYHDVSLAAGKPLFVGEFGVPGPDAEVAFDALLAAVKRAPLAAVWVYDRAGDPFDVTASNERTWILDRINPACTNRPDVCPHGHSRLRSPD